MRGKTKVVIATVVFGTLMLLGSNAHKSFAVDCYGPETMYNEGPSGNCQKSSSKVLLSRSMSSVYDEGVSVKGQNAYINSSHHLIARKNLKMDGDMFSEGMTSDSLKTLDMVAVMTKALNAKPAAGQ